MLPTRILGRTGVETTVLGIGGHLGLLNDDDNPIHRRDEAIRSVHRAIDLGIRYFDTSPMYGACEAEEHLGAGLVTLGSDARSSLTISTKVGSHPDRPHQFGANDVRWCYDNSRRVLGPIDIVFVHDPRSEEDMETILGPGGAFEVLESLRDAGEIRAIGLGNRNHRWQRQVIDSGRADIILPSYDYHPIRQTMSPLLDHAARAVVGVVNGSPYLGGLLAGGDPETLILRWGDGPDMQRARSIYAWCEARETEVGALAVQFSTREPRIATTLVGPRTVAEIEDNLRHATAQIPDAIWQKFGAFLAGLEPTSEPGGEVL
ncbi:MAG: aldo/keto reductase [Candidatus Latescibacterota bacterium]|nr:aldo/keto reductase [Candidatus Latescibacterota bacterium]